MPIRTLLSAAALGTAIAFGGIAVTAPAALAKTVEGKISSVGTDAQTVTINKKIYRVSEGAKVLVSGKPTSFARLKAGMICKASIVNSSEATLLNCTAKRGPYSNISPHRTGAGINSRAALTAVL